MRFLVMVKSDEQVEAGVLPDPSLFEEMTAYNEELVKNGVMLAGEGLKPSKEGARISYDGKQRSVIDGPFAEAKELVAGFWMIQCRDLAEAVEWLKRAPFQGGQVEIRPIYEDADFADALPPEIVEKEARLREQIAQQNR